MTSPNFRPEDVKVGSRIRCSDGVVREVQLVEGIFAFMIDGRSLYLNKLFPAFYAGHVNHMPLSEIRAIELVGDNWMDKPNLEYMFSPDQAAYLTAIEERLSKIEGSRMTPDDGANAKTFLDKSLNAFRDAIEPKQSPKVCPVSGMFMEEPEYRTGFWFLDRYGDIEYENYDADLEHQSRFIHGNCFATREAAERYAKHLKAMAKLRRLGGGNSVSFSKVETARENIHYLQVFLGRDDGYTPYALSELTPEEQNALLWPNEEK